MDQNIQNTIRSAQQGNTEAFDEVVQRYVPLVFHYTARLVRDQTLAEDITQESFIRAWQHIKTFDTERPFKPWLMRIARNCALDSLRRKCTIPFGQLSPAEYVYIEQTPDDALTPHQHAEVADTAQTVRNILSKLKPLEREVLDLHYIEELSAPEIADMLELPLETVRSRLRRARAAFRHMVEPDVPPPYVVSSTGTYANRQPFTQPAQKLAPDSSSS